MEDVKAKGGKPYAIPAGASVHKFGGLGYVGFAEEVRAQEKEMGVRFDYVIVCTVTGSTHAGMVVGFGADGRERNVIGIDASCTPAQTKAQVLDIAQKTSALVGGKDITADDIVLMEDYAYPVYGVPSKETVEAIRLSARLEGMITDPVYEGKSMQGMIDLVQKGFFPRGRRCSTPIWAVRRHSTATATRSVMAEMRAYDVAVVGLGAMGSAALYAAARRIMRQYGEHSGRRAFRGRGDREGENVFAADGQNSAGAGLYSAIGRRPHP